MPALAEFLKDPDATLDYSIDWSAWLVTGESLITSVWALSSTDLTKTLEVNTATRGTVWVSGGLPGESYTLTNHITTDGGRIDDRSIVLLMRQR